MSLNNIIRDAISASTEFLKMVLAALFVFIMFVCVANQITGEVGRGFNIQDYKIYIGFIGMLIVLYALDKKFNEEVKIMPYTIVASIGVNIMVPILDVIFTLWLKSF